MRRMNVLRAETLQAKTSDMLKREPMQKELFDKITRFYGDLEKHLIPVEGNVCKASECYECCTFAAKPNGKYVVSKMETDYIEEFYRERGYPQASLELFEEYISKKKDERGEIVHQVCPFFNLEEWGCSIYEARPLAARTYGSFFMDGSDIPPRCYFKDKGKTVRNGAFLDDNPLSMEFYELRQEHLGLRPVRISDQKTNPFLRREPDVLPVLEGENDPFIEACRLEEEGKFAEAVAAYEDARKKYPDWAFIHSCMGTDLIILKRYPEAVEAAGKAVAMRPANAFYHFLLAMASEFGGDVARAEREYRETTRLNPANAIALASLAGILFNKGEPAESLEFYEKAIAVDPDCKFYYFYSGVTLAKLRRPGEAESALLKAVGLDPSLAPAYFQLALLYKEQNRLDESNEMLKRYAELSQGETA